MQGAGDVCTTIMNDPLSNFTGVDSIKA